MIGLVVFAALSAGQSPEETKPAGASVSEIIVTGERVERSLRETPSSVAVFTGDEIERQRGSDRLEDLLQQVPNVQLGTGSQGPAIRGQDTTGPLQDLPAFLGGNRPRVTLQVDGRPVGYNEFVFGIAPLWDVRQVEIFRTPQTTTQGRNAIAGAIFVSTEDPEFEWGGKARGLIGELHRRQVAAVVTGPLLGDQVAFRFSGDLRRGRPASKIADNAIGADPNHDDFGVGRFKLLVTPAAIPGARLVASYTHTQSQMPQVERIVAPFRKRRDPFPLYGTFRTNIDAVTVNYELPLSPELELSGTFSAGDSNIRRFAPLLLGQTRIESRDFSTETLLHWRPSDAVRFDGGVHLLRTRLDQRINLFAFNGIGRFDDVQHSDGLFGEFAFKPAPRLKLTVGLRYQRDAQNRSGERTSDDVELIGFKRSFSAWLPKATLSYDLSDAVTAGVLVQRAYNPGGATLNFETGGLETFGAETLWDYELFARALLAGGRLRLNANLFYNAFGNAQRTEERVFVVPPRRLGWAKIRNVPEAQAYGLEASAEWQPSPHLKLRAAMGLLRTKILDAGKFGELEGKDFQRAPKFTASAALDWRPIDAIDLSAAVRHHSRYFSDDVNAPGLRVDSGTIVDARASYSRGGVTLFGYARNLFDAFQLTSLDDPTIAMAERPRELGIGVETRF